MVLLLWQETYLKSRKNFQGTDKFVEGYESSLYFSTGESPAGSIVTSESF